MLIKFIGLGSVWVKYYAYFGCVAKINDNANKIQNENDHLREINMKTWSRMTNDLICFWHISRKIENIVWQCTLMSKQTIQQHPSNIATYFLCWWKSALCNKLWFKKLYRSDMKSIHLPSGISKNAKIFMYQRIAKIFMMGSAQNVNALLDNRVCFCFQKIVARHKCAGRLEFLPRT